MSAAALASAGRARRAAFAVLMTLALTLSPSAGGGGGVTPGPTTGRSTDQARRVEFRVLLPLPDAGDARAELAAVHDPASPSFRRPIDPEVFAARYRVDPRSTAAVEAWAGARGVEILGHSLLGDRIDLAARRDQLEWLFGVEFVDRPGPDGQARRGVVGRPRLEPPLSTLGAVVTGLDDEPPAAVTSGHAPEARLVTTDAPELLPRGLKPADLARAYGIEPLYAAGLHGEGQTIAIISYGPFIDQDLADYSRTFGLPPADVERIDVQGGLAGYPNDFGEEAALDVEVVHAVAPAAKILVYEAPNGTKPAVAIEQIRAEGRADIVTMSYGWCDDARNLDATERASEERSFALAAAAGLDFLVSSGDWGAFTCSNWDPSDHDATAFWPATSPSILSIGGTYLWLDDEGHYLTEAGWADLLWTHGTGGGLSTVDLLPAWQTGPGVDNAYSTGMRQFPDVAAAADPDTGYQTYWTDPKIGEPRWYRMGGTSASSPFWAASLALVRQLAEREGVGKLGFLPPLLYRLASGPDAGRLFHDVVRGGNLLRNATPGWDYATGLGSADFGALAPAIVAELRARPFVPAPLP